MCLMWCHVQRWVVDNDLACVGCGFGQAAQLPSPWDCATCRHGQGTMCALTRETQPQAGRCCHWDAAVEVQALLVLEEADLAPWLRGAGGVAAVFAASPSAPPVQQDMAGRLVVARETLSVPLVYGVPSAGWGVALGWDAAADDPALGWETPLDDARQQAITGLLDALETGDPEAIGDALTQLQRALDGNPTPLPEGWAVLLGDVMRLGAVICATEPSLAAQIVAVATALARAREEGTAW